MQTQLDPRYQNTPQGRRAEAVLRQCVHCGFCNATCPTHRVLGDELDGPRGRIYLMKQVFEGQTPTRSTQLHLDRCIGCRHCESTCPSGVQYGELLEVGQQVVDEQVPRRASERALRWLLRTGLTSPLFAPALKLGQALRGWLPAALREAVPLPPALHSPAWPSAQELARHTRQVVMLKGCVQPALRPHIDAATARVLDACGVKPIVASGSTCCGALHAHLGDAEGARRRMRQNIDAWWPWLEGRAARKGAAVAAEALVVNASGCGAIIKEYGHWLADDPAYADKAKRVSAWAQDLGEWLAPHAPTLKRRIPQTVQVAPLPPVAPPDPDEALGEKTMPNPAMLLRSATSLGRVTYHPPCSLTHAQRQVGRVEALLGELGFEVQMAHADAQQCCGAGGAYNVLQGELARTLRSDKLAKLQAESAGVIVSANIGCMTHLQAGTRTPVRHWIELVDEVVTRRT